MQNNKKRFFYVLYFNKTWVFDQSERAQGPIYVITSDKNECGDLHNFQKIKVAMNQHYIFLKLCKKLHHADHNLIKINGICMRALFIYIH